jgi:hypothetical protein
VEGASKLREDRQVGMETNPVDATDPQRSERVFVLQPAELALDRRPLPVGRLPALRLARHQRV